MVRPANFPPSVPGRGWTVSETADGTPVAVINLIGRVFMDSVDCPFRTVEALLPDVRARARVIIVDMHGEATSEKVAMGWFLNGKVSAVLGSHTHVQTADERVLPGGTAYITDVGMCGPTESVIGVKKELVLQRFLTHMPVKFEVATGPVVVQGAFVEVDPATGQAECDSPSPAGWRNVMSWEDQVEAIRRGTVDVLPEDELGAKLPRSAPATGEIRRGPIGSGLAPGACGGPHQAPPVSGPRAHSHLS